MSNYQIQQGTGGVLALTFGSDIGNSRTLKNITAQISDNTNAYLADAGGGGKFYVVPRQNFGGTPVSAVTTVTVTTSAEDATLGGALTPVVLTVDIDPAPAPPPHASTLVLQVGATTTLTTQPADPGSTSISVTS